MMYCLYTKHVPDIIQHVGLLHHSYADDTELYIVIEKKYFFWEIVRYRAVCQRTNYGWNAILKLNDDEIEFIVFKSKHNTNSFAGTTVQVHGGTSVRLTQK